MTLQGTVNKTAFSLFLLIAAGSFTFSPDYSWLIWPGFIGGFIVAMITIFKKTLSCYCSNICSSRGLGSWWNILHVQRSFLSWYSFTSNFVDC